MARVEGKVALVTGAASRKGLGFAAAKRLSEEGAAVVLTDLDETSLKGATAELVAGGARAIAVRQDVVEPSDWKAAVDLALTTFGSLDVLVNNAGICFKAPILDVAPEDFRRQIDVNLTGTFLGAQEAIRAFRGHGQGGSIINISSVAGLVGVPNLQAYTASKGGVRLLTKSIALECAAEGIRCNSVHPGKIMTDMLEGARRRLEDPSQLAGDVPMRRVGEPVDIANCILFLASDEAKYITGAEFTVDGGLTAQ